MLISLGINQSHMFKICRRRRRSPSDVWSHRAGRLPVAPAAVDAADLSLRAGEGETLEIWPETHDNKESVKASHDRVSLQLYNDV